MTIKSPYNFVPLSDKVVFSDWADQVSHDIPFEDGISGKIDLSVTLQSDTYIRNGGKWSDEAKKDDNSPCQKFFTAKVNGEDKYIIPGTSFKGMIRNVLEIASFGKMQRVNDDRYSIRDLHNPRYTSKLVNKVKAGWLEQCEDESGKEIWTITPCSFARIRQTELERYFGVAIGQEKESSVKKYNKIKKSGKHALTVWFNPLDMDGSVILKIDSIEHPEPYKQGTVVVTGQPAPRNNKGAKYLEFIFYDERTESFDVTKLKADFEFVNSDANEKELEEWKYWKGKIEHGERVPVFYVENAQGTPDTFGLAMMYRLPYENSVMQTVAHTSKDHLSPEICEKYKCESAGFRPDLSDLMFGYTNKDDSLRGRVQFSHFVSAKSVGEIETAGLKTTVLGGPKASYYPNYLEQPVNLSSPSNYKLFWDKDARIRGWKRYPAQNVSANYPKPPEINGKVNEDVSTKLIPLKAGAEFKGSVRFFNLKPEELGALLWTLTWGGDKYCQHNIGMGKPLGLGRISIDILEKWNRETSGDLDLNDPVEQFKKYMTKEIAGWETSEQITELKRMADIRYWNDEWTTSYPVLGMNVKDNEFEYAKGNRRDNRPGNRLDRYSEIADQHDVKVETLEEQKKQAEKKAKIAAASEGLAPELQKVFESLRNLTKGKLNNKLKNNELTDKGNELTEKEVEVLRTQPSEAWEKWQWEVIDSRRKNWDK